MSFIAGIEYLEYTCRGADPAKGTVVCLHGIGGDHKSFEPQCEALSDEYRMLAWNMPGYRGSTPLESLDFSALGHCFIEWIDQLAFDSVHLMGQSIGGMLAQWIAFHFPDRVRSLVLIATTSAFGGRDDEFKNKFLEARLAPLDNGETMSDLATRFVPEIVGSNAPLSAVEAAIASMAAVPEATYRKIMGCLVTFNMREQWPQHQSGICLIAGSEDSNAPARTMEKMALLRLPNESDEFATNEFYEYHCIEGAGHLVNLEQAEACNTIIRRFLSKK